MNYAVLEPISGPLGSCKYPLYNYTAIDLLTLSVLSCLSIFNVATTSLKRARACWVDDKKQMACSEKCKMDIAQRQ